MEKINLNEPMIMGILNTTPDSFSDGGDYLNQEKAIKRVAQMIKDGAQIIDVGGESTRPGAEFIDAKREISRVVPIIKAIKEKFDVHISIDTYKSEVAKAAISAGATIVNDVWGNKYDQQMLDVVVKNDVYYVWMFNQKTNKYENDMIDTMKMEFLQVKCQLVESGYDIDKLIFDPGIGFAKDINQNLIVLNRLSEFKTMDSPILLGTSRKSLFKTMLDLEEPKERSVATAATTALGVTMGAIIFRVHDVKDNYEAMKVATKIMRGKDD